LVKWRSKVRSSQIPRAIATNAEGRAHLLREDHGNFPQQSCIMGSSSTIEWTDATWNPVAGCTVLTAGCTNCYAMRMAARLEVMGQAKYAGTTRLSGKRRVWTGKVVLDRHALSVPHGWRKGRRVFVNSMSDLFHEAVPADFIQEVFAVMRATPGTYIRFSPSAQIACWNCLRSLSGAITSGWA
jgi:hypothetical protein